MLSGLAESNVLLFFANRSADTAPDGARPSHGFSCLGLKTLASHLGLKKRIRPKIQDPHTKLIAASGFETQISSGDAFKCRIF